jgi:hypothetical protein
MATWRDVRRLALALPGTVEETTSGGNRAWTVNKKFVAWERPLRKADVNALGPGAPTGAILGVRTPDLELKEVLVASNPSVFFTTPHFDGYPAVLIRLAKIGTKELKHVLIEAWLVRAPKREVKKYLEANAQVQEANPEATSRRARLGPV